MIWLRLAPLCVLVGCAYDVPGEDITPESKPLVGFEFPTSGADEASGTVSLKVKLSKPSTEQVTVPYQVLSSGGNAEPGNDFIVSGTQLVFAPEITELDIAVAIEPDNNEMESDETFTIALADPIGATLDVDKAIHQVKISDHLLPRINFQVATPTSHTEGGAQTTLTLIFTTPDGLTQVAAEPDGSTIVIGVAGDATAPTDLEDLGLADGVEITIPPNAMTVDLPLAEVDDALDEEDVENLLLELKGASQNLVLGTVVTHQHAIADNDDPPKVRFQVVASNVDEDGATALIAVELDAETGRVGGASVAITRNATSTAVGGDATIDTPSVAFEARANGVAGETTKMVTITINNDAIDENAELLILDLASQVNADLGNQPTHTLTINADAADPAPTVTFSDLTDTVDEDTGGGGNDGITRVQLSAVSGKTVTVDVSDSGTGTATSGDDYVAFATTTITIPAGQTMSGDIVVNVVASSPNNEPDETVVLTLSNENNATLGTTANITYTLTVQE